VTVEAVGVHHEPVREAVGYRITTPAGVVVISGDTRVCDEVLELASGADVLVHEACRVSAMAPLTAGTPFETIFDYHSDTVALGSLADAAGVGHLVLTHLIPPPTDDESEQTFSDDVRAGGYCGPLTVGHDLFTIELG
jgi:ribonuclease Z